VYCWVSFGVILEVKIRDKAFLSVELATHHFQYSMPTIDVLEETPTDKQFDVGAFQVGASLGTYYRSEPHFGFSQVPHLLTLVLVTAKEVSME